MEGHKAKKIDMRFISVFISEVKETWDDLKEYYHQEKVLRWFTAVWIFVLYGIRLAQEDIFVDSEVMLESPGAQLFGWYGHRRFGLVLTKKIFGMFRLMPYLANAMMVLVLWCVCMGICYCFYHWSGKKESYRKGSFLFVAVFLSAPCLVEQFNFLLQAFEVAMAMAYCVIAVFCSGKWIYEKKSIFWMVPAFGFAVWAFGSYQSFDVFYIAFVILSYITVYLQREECCGLKEGILQVLFFLLGMAAFQICADLINKVLGANSGYVDSMIFWGRESAEFCWQRIRLDIDRFYRGTLPVFFDRYFLGVAFVASLLAFMHGVLKRNKKILCLMFALVVLILTPLMITLITGMNQPIRSQLAFPLAYAYYMLLLYVEACWMMEKTDLRLALRSAFCVLFFGFGLLTAYRQGIRAGQLWETAHESYVNDKLLANRIYQQVCQVADTENMSECYVVFVGARESDFGGDPTYGDVIGSSFFQWDANGTVGVNSRVNSFLDVLGMETKAPDIEEYQEALKGAKDFPAWPAAGSVVKLRDNLVVVKLSHYEEYE